MLRKKLKLPDIEQQGENYLEATASKQLELDSALTNKNQSLDLQTNQSIYFATPPTTDNTLISNKMMDIQRNLNEILSGIDFLKNRTCYVYNPTIYACEPYEQYLKLYCNKEKKILFIGMNPGPWGMCQTGIPFGEVNAVKDWLRLNGHVGQPSVICDKRKIEGFNCSRKEVSGDRFWNFFKRLCVTPECFFNQCFIYNYCPLAFMKADGGNITPNEIEVTLRNTLQESCDAALGEVIQLLKPEIIIGIGRYAEERVSKVVKNSHLHIKVLFMPHPSPRSVNNNNWPEKAETFIKENNLMQYFQ